MAVGDAQESATCASGGGTARARVHVYLNGETVPRHDRGEETGEEDNSDYSDEDGI